MQTEMRVDVAPTPPYTPREGQLATFDDVESKIISLSQGHAAAEFGYILRVFEAFLTSEEQTKVSK